MNALQAVYCGLVLSIPLETVLYFKTDEGSSSGISISRVLGIVLFFLSLVQRRDCFKRLPAAFWLVSWYLAAFTISELWVPAQLTSRFRELQLTLAQSAVLFVISVNLFDDEAFRRRLFRFFGWGMFAAAVAMLGGVLGIDLDAAGRGTFGAENPNTVGAMFALGALCLAGDLARRGERGRAASFTTVLGVTVLAVGIMRTGSRGALTALLAGFAGLAACGERGSLKKRALLTLALLSGLGLMIRREFQYGTPMAERLQLTVDEGDTAGRAGIYDAAWTMFEERPLFGFGGANNRFVLGAQLNYAYRDTGAVDRDTHNTYLAVLTEVGLVGGLPFLAALLIAWVHAWRHGRRVGDGLPFALLCALLISSASGTGTRQKLFWIVFAAAAAGMPRRERRASQITLAGPLSSEPSTAA